MIQLTGYRLIEQIQDGYQTAIYRAEDELGQRCVLKVLKTDFPNQQQIKSIRREFELSQQLPDLHPHRQLVDVDSTLALRMDADGITLAERITREPFELDDALLVLENMCEVVAILHRQGLVHGNLQPANWMWSSDHSVTLLSLGMAWSSPAPVVSTHLVDLQYIAPEQTGRMTGQEVDTRADLYALGAIFYECLEGTPPFEANSAMALISRHIAQPPPTPTRATAPIIERFIGQLMAKSCVNRYQSVQGVLADVRMLRRALQDRKLDHIETLGEHDIRSVLELDHRYHGHPRALGELLGTFAEVLNSRCKLVFLKGPNGVGKTRLLQSLQSALIEKNVIFLHSRFSGHTQKPYGVLIDIIRQFTHHALMQDEKTIAFWRHRIKQGAMGQERILTRAVPEMELIIGAQSPHDIDRQQAALHKLHETMASVVRTIVSPTHPFVLCLDDVHLADLDSLKLMVRLLNALEHRPLLVVAAADSGTWEFSPRIQSVLTNLRADLSIIELDLLKPEALTQWLAQTLQQPNEQVHELAHIGHAYTKGHPQLFAEWVQGLHDQDLLCFDDIDRQWTWKTDAIRAQIEEIPIDRLIHMRYERMPERVQQALGIAACFAEEIDIEIIQDILDLSTLKLHNILTQAQEAGVLSRHATSANTRPMWSFTHQTVKEAIEDHLTATQRATFHLHIGRGLEQRQAQLHVVVHHLNLARELLSDEEQMSLLALNVRAGQQVRMATVFDRAVEHFALVRDLLTEDIWLKRRILGMNFVYEAIQACLAAKLYEDAQHWLEIYKQRMQTEEEQTTASSIQISIHFGKMEHQLGIDVALKVLSKLGFEFPENPSYLSIATESVLLQTQLFGLSDQELIDAPPMDHARVEQAMAVMYAVIKAAYLSNETIALLFVLKMVSLSVDYGATKETPLAYASFGYLLSSTLNQIDKGYRFGQIALRLAEKYTTGSHKAYTHLCVYNYIAPWRDPAAQQIEPLFDAYRIARDSGDHDCAAFCLLDRLKHGWFAGRSVDKLRDGLEQMRLYAQQTRMSFMESIFEPWFALCDAVQHGDVPVFIPSPSAIESIQSWHAHHTTLTVWIYATYFHDMAMAKQCHEAFLENKRQIVNVMEQSTMHMLSGLYHSRCANRQSGLERQGHMAKLLVHIGRLKHWSLYAAHNHKHRQMLLEAEYAKLTDRPRKAARNYDESIRLALEHGFYAEAALFAERACRFYRLRHQRSTAARYLEICQIHYKQAGFYAKIDQLNAQYAELTYRQHHIEGQHPIDMNTLVKSMQSLSEEIQLERLIGKLLHLVIEHSGAHRGVVVLQAEDRSLRVSKEVLLDGQPSTLQPDQNLDDITHEIATGVLHFTARTRETIVLDHAAQSMQFFSDPYIQKQAPRSLMCLPIVRQNRLLALIYLENQLTQGAFTHDKQELLKLLSAQIAISLENAMLYNTMEQKVQSRTEALEDALKALEEAASRDYLTGVYNRLKFTQITSETFKTHGPHSIVILDLDHFKRVNDKHGHRVGDDVLIHITKHLQAILSEHDTLARWGGEEFVILLPNTAERDAEHIANHLRKSIVAHPQASAGTITFSAGVAQFIPGESLDDLIHRADTALYLAKDSGRNCVKVYAS